MRVFFFLKIYDFLYLGILPFIRAYHFLKGKPPSFEKYGIASYTLPKDKKVIWFHGSSIGEALCGLALLKSISQKYSNVFFVFTTGTSTSAKVLREKLPPNACYQSVPWDYSKWVQRFLNHWKPSVAFFIEADYWPNLILQSEAKKIPLVLLNGRISPKSLKRWSFFRPLFAKMMKSFLYIFPQTLKDRHIFQPWAAHTLTYLGNLKYSSLPLTYDVNALKNLHRICQGRLVWCAASTHEGEEEAVSLVHKSLKTLFHDLLTILVPRHPERSEKIVADLRAKGFFVAVRSKGEEILRQTDIYVADTIGEMGLFYELCPIVFVGGTLVPVGGHNPIEPAQQKCALLTGPHTFNNKQIFEELYENQAIRVVQNPQEMIEVLKVLFEDETQRQALIDNAYTCVHQHAATAEKVLKDLSPLLNKVLQ